MIERPDTSRGEAQIRTIIAAAKPLSELEIVERRGRSGFVWRDPETSIDHFIETGSAHGLRKETERRTVKDTNGVKETRKEGATHKQRKRTPQRDNLLSLIGDDVELWRDPNGEGCATFPVNGHRENRAIRSREFKHWLSLSFYEAHAGTLGGQALEDALRVLEARAARGRVYKTWRRMGKLDNALYLDLVDPQWRAVEITSERWQIVDSAPVKFMRSPAMRSLPEPAAGGLIESLRRFVNVATEDDFTLLVAYLVAVFRVEVPFPILILIGEQGSGKSVLCRLLRAIVDPNEAPIRSVPRDERDLIVSAVNSHLLCFDNLSGVAGWLSDGLCRISTGSGFSTRKLHTDREEEVFSASRPIMLNGIASLAERADLSDRALVVHLPTIIEEARQSEEEFWRDFEEAAPEILGSLLDAVRCALCKLPTTRLERSPRMADFARWVTAAEPGLGLEEGTFLKAYEANRAEVFVDALDADLVATAIRDLVKEHDDQWEGTATELLAALNGRVTEGTRKGRSWPGSPASLGMRLRRCAPLLRTAGLELDHGHSGERFIRLKRRGDQ